MSDEEEGVSMADVRQAVRSAAVSISEHADSSSVSASATMPDQYYSEAESLLQAGMPYSVAADRISVYMGLHSEPPGRESQIWYIKQSAKWIALETKFSNGCLSSWSLLRINGPNKV